MKLNPDCIRDILFCVEETTGFNNPFSLYINKYPLRLQKYTSEEVLYHISQASLSHLILGLNVYDDGEYLIISDLSPTGHEFLANIRQDNIWNGIKGISKKVGSTSLNALISIASNVISEIIKAQFQIGQIPNV